MPRDSRLDNPDELPPEFKEWLVRYLDQERSLAPLGRLLSGGANKYTEQNITPDRAFDPTGLGFTLIELGHVVGTLIKDLRAKGIVG